MKQGFAFFDLDYTLLPYDTLLLLSNFVLKRRRLRILYLFVFLPVAPLALIGLVGSRGIKRAFLSLLAGLDPALIMEWSRELAAEVRPLIHPELESEILRHRREGRTLVLTTASPDFYVRPLAEMLGFDEVRATGVDMSRPWRIMPRIPGMNNKGNVKILHMAGLFPADVSSRIRSEVKGTKKGDLSWFHVPNSHSYSDSPADLPLLRIADHGTLIDPVSKALQAEGAARGWNVILPKARATKGITRLFMMARQMTGTYSYPKAASS
ncbi:MAG: haloacid dehalogenase-like hydrolase [Spirochaetia bacterium]|nr:haloacid dehalogenase-like hydrolase [Spirochaetia bacterium]